MHHSKACTPTLFLIYTLSSSLIHPRSRPPLGALPTSASHIRIVFAPFTCNMRRTAHCKNEGVRFSISWSNPQVKWHCLCCQWRTARATLFRRFSTSWSTFQVKWHCLCCQWRTARDTVFRSCSPSHMAPIWAVPESFSSRHMHMSPTSASTMCPYNYVSR